MADRGEAIEVRHPVALPGTLRQTLVSMFDTCQYSGYLSVQTGGLKPAHPIFRGKAFHETVQRATNTMITNGELTIAPDDAKAVMLEVLNDHPEWVVPAYAMDELRVMVHRWATHFTLPSPHCVTEQPWSLVIGGQVVTGTIDLCWRDKDTLHVRDYKSGWNAFTQAEVAGKDTDTKLPRGARAAQLIVYALLAADGKPETPLPFSQKGLNAFDCRYVFPMLGGDDGMLERWVPITRPELIEHREWLKGVVTRMDNRFAAGKFTAVQGSHCSRCPDRTQCPLKDRAQAQGPFTRPPREAAEDWAFLRADADSLWNEIKVYVEQFGPIDVGKDQVLEKRATASGSRLTLSKKAVA